MFTKSQRLVIIYGAWVFGVLGLLALFQSISVDIFFGLCLFGLIIIVELSGPYTTKPGWRAHINKAIFIGMLGFIIIVMNKVLIILGTS